jgi:hypothetical protein
VRHGTRTLPLPRQRPVAWVKRPPADTGTGGMRRHRTFHTRAERSPARPRGGHGRNATAARATLRIRPQSPASTAFAGASQDPPTQVTF